MSMSVLSLEKAIRLYNLLHPYIPDPYQEQTALEFVHKIVYNIKEQNPRVYVDALALMQETDADTIMKTYSPQESLIEFERGLEENQIIALRDFCLKVGLHG